MFRTWMLVAAVGSAGVLWSVSATQSSTRSGDENQAPQQRDADARDNAREDMPLRDYMRKKLEASNQVLEGLCTDDFGLIEQGARRLTEMSTSERWRVTNDPMYRQFSGDFREITQQLVEAAEKKNLDRATLKWVDATMACIDCHRFVRGIRIADSSRE